MTINQSRGINIEKTIPTFQNSQITSKNISQRSKVATNLNLDPHNTELQIKSPISDYSNNFFISNPSRPTDSYQNKNEQYPVESASNTGRFNRSEERRVGKEC